MMARNSTWLLLLVLSACVELEPGRSHFEDQDGGSDGAVAAEDAGALRDGAAPTQLSSPVGQWALFVEDRKCMSAIGTEVENIIWSWYLVEVLEVGETGGAGEQLLRQRVQLCSQALSPLVGGLRTYVPEVIPDGLPPRAVDAFLLGVELGSDYLGGEVVEYWGMTDIGLETAVPTDPEDPRVVDGDGDGHPGVSFVTTNSLGEPICEVRVVQRTRLRITGAVERADRIVGGILADLDKVVLDATSPLCSTQADLVPSPSPGRFVMLRVDGAQGARVDLDLDGDGRVDCAELRSSEAVLEEMGGATRLPPDDAVCR